VRKPETGGNLRLLEICDFGVITRMSTNYAVKGWRPGTIPGLPMGGNCGFALF